MKPPLYLLLKHSLILIFILGSQLCIAEKAYDQTPITVVAGGNNAPFSFLLPDGTPTGLYVEFWKLWSQTNNIPIKIKILSFEDAIKAVKNKKTIHSGLFINDKRQQWADFSSPIHSVKTGIIYNDQFPATTQLKNLKDIIISVQEKSFQESYLINNYPNLELLNYRDGKEAINKLLNHQVQAVVGEIPYLKSQLAKNELIGVFNLADEILMENTVHAVIAKGQPNLLKIINLGIENMSPNKINKIELKWLPNLPTFFNDIAAFDLLTAKEIQWLKENSKFSLGIDNNNPPFDFRNKQGVFSGISSDYIDYVNQQLNINVEPVMTSSWLDAFVKFKNNKLDLLSSIAVTKSRSKYLNFTIPYFTASTVIVTQKKSSYVGTIDDLKYKKLGLLRGFAAVEIVKIKYPEIEIYLLDSISDGFDKLEAGEIDAYIGMIYVVNSEINKRQNNDLMIAGFSSIRFEMAMSVRKGLEPLVPILNKVFANMNDKQKSAIANNWLRTHIKNGTSFQTILIWTVPILIFLLLIIFVIMKFNNHLKKEIKARKKTEKELKHIARHDMLTALPNWRLFEELSSLALSHAKRNENKQSIMFIDIDGFKFVNDSFGHKVGDHLLVLIAQRLKDCVRDSDIVARIGGDEFCVHLCNQCNEKDTKVIALKIVNSLSSPFNVDGNTINIGASVGISVYPSHGDDVESLIQKADSAMYAAKKSGKNTYHFFQTKD